MRLLSFLIRDQTRLGLLLKGKIVDLNSVHGNLFGNSKTFPSSMVSLLESELALSKARMVEKVFLRDWSNLKTTREVVHDIEDVKILAPIPYPRKNIICLGLNYIDHAIEVNVPIPEHPIFFTKPPSSVLGPDGTILLPKCSRKIDYEVELAFVFGRGGKNISEREAYDYVAGYTVFNDVTARDLQRKHKQWYKGKSLDTFAPMGPCLVTKDEVPDPHNLSLFMELNGKVMQKSNTKNMIFKIPTLIKFISADMTVEPGDIVATGTPSGVGSVRKPPVYLKNGDILRAGVEKVGILQNRVACY